MRVPPRILPALVTPFTGDGELDLAAHRHNLRTLRGRGVTGFLLAGSTGEGPYLEPGERARLVAAARTELGDAPFLLCGVAAETTRAALAQAREAAAAGADAVLVMTPTTLVRGRHRLVADHLAAVAEEGGLPLLVYSVPPVTAYEIPVETVRDLARHDGVVGMKDSGGDAGRVPLLGDLLDTGFLLFCGASPAVGAAVAAGAYGAITASANYAASLLESILAGDAAAQVTLTRLTAAVERHGIVGTKTAAAALGLRPGLPRAPLRPPATAVVEEIRRALAEAGLPG